MNALKRIWRSITFTVDSHNPDGLCKQGSISGCMWFGFSMITAASSLTLILFALLSLIGKLTTLVTGDYEACPSYTNHTANIEQCVKKAWSSYFMCINSWLLGCSFYAFYSILVIAVSLYLFIVSIRAAYEIYLALKPLEEVIIEEDNEYEYLSNFPRIRFMFSNDNDANLRHLIEPNEVVDRMKYIELNSGYAEKWGFHLSRWNIAISIAISLSLLVVWVILPGIGILSAKIIKMPIWSCQPNTTISLNLPMDCLLVSLLEILVSLVSLSLLWCIFNCGRGCTNAVKSAEEIPLIKTKYAAELATGDNL